MQTSAPTSPTRLDRVVSDLPVRLPLSPVRNHESDPKCHIGEEHLPHQRNGNGNGNGNSSVPEPGHTTNQPSVAERARAATVVLNRYRIEYKNDWEIPESILYSQSQIKKALERNHSINLVIPAFPFKSSNRSKKVLGPLPDEAERLSLLHLNGLCLAIQDATDSDTFLTIVSDGITYNGKHNHLGYDSNRITC